MNCIIPEKDLWDSLLRVEKPGRYTGGEYGITAKHDKAILYVALSYPDLYEIGMSNHAIRILYCLLNSLPGISCERVFAPAPDFEEELRKKNIPLYSLESGLPLNEFDIICFSLGYELNATNVLTILDLGRAGINNEDRGESDPVVIAGGPAVTNPVPFASFIDCFFIGEAEGKVEELFTGLCSIKRKGHNRQELLHYILQEPSVWSSAKPDHKASKNIWMGFSTGTLHQHFPVPNISVIQDQGVVEIMRGCPNICRFCHSSIYYRPFRLKMPCHIFSEVEHLILCGGYRRITLTSLSSGDYRYIDELVRILSARYKQAGISFSLPSLRIDSLALSLLKDISEVRKSGLTFAVETPDPAWQAGVNKSVSFEKTMSLLLEARKMGWNKAKFYFMIGLPLYQCDESDMIIEFAREARKRTKMQLTIAISTFIPKPHTPFQWAPQLSEDIAFERIMHIKRNLSEKYFKISYHSPFSSLLEGIISRGTKEVGDIIFNAYKKGARLDAWDDYIRRSIWRNAIGEAGTDIISGTLGARKSDEPLPWDSVDLGVSKQYLKNEWEKAVKREYTEACSSSCSHPCGICGRKIKVMDTIVKKEITDLESLTPFRLQATSRKRLLFSYSKTDKAVFLSHLNSMHIFERALLRAGYLPYFTKGFNPKPTLEFASPLALGVESRDEIAACEIENFDSIEKFKEKINNVLPEGFSLEKCKELPSYKKGTKKISLARLYWGSDYLLTQGKEIKQIIHIFSLINNVNEEESELYEFSPALDSFFMLGKDICIRWKKIEKKGCNIIHFLERLTGRLHFESGIRIIRMKTLIKTGEEPGCFFDVL
ncbi:MAG: TIGR03960 family B12-binding radical SAM protein [Spirochaetales bacterium]|nr:TIGR03960 family B12-binding radical SAM protein [Spirochaetales bacterium]